MLGERLISEALERGAGTREGVGPAGLILELGKQPRSDLLLLRRRKLRDFGEGFFKKSSHDTTVR
jgi:hypothetical protein